jgi:AcrR family transcriptional regulator
MPIIKPAKETDGRRLRSERSRQSILDAILALVDEGILVPTAQQVSERAGVGIRSVFRHFSDMESLFVEADIQTRNQYQVLFEGGNREGTLPQRVLHAVEQHAIAYEAIGNRFLSTKAQLWRYSVLREQYERAQRQVRKDLDTWLPELKALSSERREIIDMMASFETWHRLRELQSLNKKSSIQLVNKLLNGIIADS